MASFWLKSAHNFEKRPQKNGWLYQLSPMSEFSSILRLTKSINSSASEWRYTLVACEKKMSHRSTENTDKIEPYNLSCYSGLIPISVACSHQM